MKSEIEDPKVAGRNEGIPDRYEAKYVIPRPWVPRIRRFVHAFCAPDPAGEGDPPSYTVTTLQLDSPVLALHYAKEHEAVNRFKLRVRTYGRPGESPVFLEIKRKFGDTVVKSRVAIPFERWGEDLIRNLRFDLDFASEREEYAFLEFVRLTREIGALPALLIRYTRESYVSRIDRYARVTFDSHLTYQPTSSWTSWGRDESWRPIDTPAAQDQGLNVSGVILELKALRDVPRWMIDLVKEFNLARCGHCKYSTAFWQEALFRGVPRLPIFANDILAF